MWRRLVSMALLAALLASAASALSGCVVVPYDYGYRDYHGYYGDHDDRGHYRR